VVSLASRRPYRMGDSRMRRFCRDSTAGVVALSRCKVDNGHDALRRRPRATRIVRNLARCLGSVARLLHALQTAAEDPDPFFAHQQLARYWSICEQLFVRRLCAGAAPRGKLGGAVRVPGDGLRPPIRRGTSRSPGAYAPGWVPRIGSLRSAVALKARVSASITPAMARRRHGTHVQASTDDARGDDRLWLRRRPAPRACSNASGIVRGQTRRWLARSRWTWPWLTLAAAGGRSRRRDSPYSAARATESHHRRICESAGIIPHELLVRPRQPRPADLPARPRPPVSHGTLADECCRISVAGRLRAFVRPHPASDAIRRSRISCCSMRLKRRPRISIAVLQLR